MTELLRWWCTSHRRSTETPSADDCASRRNGGILLPCAFVQVIHPDLVLAEVRRSLLETHLEHGAALLATIESWRTALDEIACWREGAFVSGTFDEPGSAKRAREALRDQPPADGCRILRKDGDA